MFCGNEVEEMLTAYQRSLITRIAIHNQLLAYDIEHEFLRMIREKESSLRAEREFPRSKDMSGS